METRIRFENAKSLIQPVADAFQITGSVSDAVPYGSGHINDTFAVTVDGRGRTVRYIFQRINGTVFREPEKLMENIERVCRHAQLRLDRERVPEANRRALRLVATREDRWLHKDQDDNHWRVYYFIEGARSHEIVQSPYQASEAARAFGKFQRLMSDLPGKPLHDTIPDFHNTSHRFAQLMESTRGDPSNRVRLAREELRFAEKRAADTSVIVDLLREGKLPQRITHNDTKLNNVLIDDRSGEGVCVIDLDTVMQGSALYDFGDLVRTATNPAAEDERDLGVVCVRLEMFEALVNGYMEGTRSELTDLEIDLLPVAGKLMTLENGIRFLTDFLEGDVYYKIDRAHHNLDRCRTQFALVGAIEKEMPKLREIVKNGAAALRR